MSMYDFKVERNFSDNEKKLYCESIKKAVEKQREICDKKRTERLCDIDRDREKYRREFREMLGWPLNRYENSIPDAEKTLVCSENGISIYKIVFTIPFGIKFCGMLFCHDKSEKLPLVIFQHGKLGSPELCADMYRDGTYNYNNAVKRILKYNVNVFAPQLLLWDQDGRADAPGYSRLETDAALKQIGGSVTALEVYEIMKSIDYFSACDFTDGEKIAMIGLSYGGMYTLFTAAADTRIKAALSCCWYTDRYLLTMDGDWSWFNSANLFFDNEVVRLIYPRYLCIADGKNDALISAEGAEREFGKLKSLLSSGDNLDFVLFDGEHEFINDDFYIKKVIDVLNSAPKNAISERM